MRFIALAAYLPLFPLTAARLPRRQEEGPIEEEPEPEYKALYDEACNIGFCSIMGATIGGWGGNYTYVHTLAEFTSAVSGSGAGVIIVNATITGIGTPVAIGSGKSIIGNPGSSLTNVPLNLASSRNIILRNHNLTNSPITLTGSRSIWLDHLTLSSPLTISSASDYISISNNLFTGSFTATIDGVHVTITRNHFQNLKSTVAFRNATAHVFNSFFEKIEAGLDVGAGTDLLLEASVFEDVTRPVYSSGGDSGAGKATLLNSYLGEGTSEVPAGEMNADSLPYPYDWYVWDMLVTRERVAKEAGQTLEFEEPLNLPDWDELE
ncbi:hypothetical protein OQA88_1010 [Cercophora sp. LCS_1]